MRSRLTMQHLKIALRFTLHIKFNFSVSLEDFLNWKMYRHPATVSPTSNFGKTQWQMRRQKRRKRVNRACALDARASDACALDANKTFEYARGVRELFESIRYLLDSNITRNIAENTSKRFFVNSTTASRFESTYEVLDPISSPGAIGGNRSWGKKEWE